jgi:3-hydroxyacyl-[acyl-carrier-protein] dehydratase
MAPSLLFTLDGLDLETEVYDAAAIEAVNPHRGVMRLIDGILHKSECGKDFVAYRDIGDDEFWVEGHIPGRPIYPGVLMLESAAQLASFGTLHQDTREKFMGFAGLDDVRFRGQVKPGDRLLILGREIENRPRRSIYYTQGLVDGTLVFEATIRGMPM